MNSKPIVTAIIPARYASTRLPAKPLIDLCGKPMIQRVFEQTKQATLVTNVIVATDHGEIAAVVRGFGGECVMTPVDIRSGSDRIAAVAKNLTRADIIVNVQGDEPLIEPRMIDEAIRPMIDNPKIDVATLVKKIDTAEDIINPNVVKVILDMGGDAIYFSRAPIPYNRNTAGTAGKQNQITYYKHIGLYVYRKDFLLEFASWDESQLERTEKLEQLRIIEHGFKIRAAITAYDSIPIDTPDDAERVRTILQQLKGTHV
jgi:3-deoxy-manno-octulosonate cytidylyltransferase (CMP-KDO synthetase)